MRARQRGQVLLLSIIVVGLVLINTLVIITGSMLYSSNASHSVDALQALNLAEAGADKALASLNKLSGGYNGEPETLLGNGSYSVTVTTTGNIKIIQATGYVPSKKSPRAKRTIQISASKGNGVSFHYGVQVGEGGLQLGNNNVVTGSVYSNGNITAGNNNIVTGDLIVAGGTQPTANQQVDCVNPSCADFSFGKIIAGQNILDVAQGFSLTTTQVVNRVSLKVKKTGSLADATVRIVGDNAGRPNKDAVLATGYLYSVSVASTYGFVDVGFDVSPLLTANTPYWIVVDTSTNAGNWSWQQDTAQTYTRGAAFWSTDWQTRTPIWNTISGDLSFQLYIGGTITYLDGGSSFQARSTVRANTIKNSTITGAAYYQTLINSTAGQYYPNSVDQPPQAFPISEGVINEWKNQAATALTTVGDVSGCPSSLGPQKIVGSINFGNNCRVTITSPIWVTGNLNFGNTNTLTLASFFGSSSGMIIVDGQIIFGNGNVVQGSGASSSILMLLSQYDSRTNGLPAIDFQNGANSTFVYASKGIVQPGNSNNFKELTAWQIRLANNAQISYESGLVNAFFTAGPSGTFSIIKGSYQLK